MYISDVQGDIIGGSISGSGNIVGKNIVVGPGTINISEQRLEKIQNNEYTESLKAFSEMINNQLKDRRIPEEKVKSINQNLDDLAKEIEEIKPGKEKLDYVKQMNVESKTATLIQKILDVLPEAAETASTFTPLAPFSKLIGKGVQQIVNAVKKNNI